MEPSKLDAFEKTSSDDFLKNHEFGVELHGTNTDMMCEFRNRCREFVDRLVDVILGQQVVSSDFLQGLYCFCPELLLEGDDHHVFQLFSRLVRVLVVVISLAVMLSQAVRSLPPMLSMLGRGIKNRRKVQSRSKMLPSICSLITASCRGKVWSGC